MEGYGHTYEYAIREGAIYGYFPIYSGYDVLNTRLNRSTGTGEATGDDGMPLDDGTIEDRRTRTFMPQFDLLTEAELEALLDLWGYRVPAASGLLNTGDEIPWWIFGSAGAGVLALVLLLLTRKRKERG